MSSPGPHDPHQPPQPYGPVPMAPGPGREQMRRSAIAGGVIAAVASALAALLASGEWRYRNSGLPIEGVDKTFWELGSDEGFVPFTLFGWLTILCMAVAVTVFLLPKRHQRRTFAMLLMVLTILQALFGWLAIAAAADLGYGPGGAGVVLGLILALAPVGAVMAWAGSGLHAPRPGPMPPMPPTGPNQPMR